MKSKQAQQTLNPKSQLFEFGILFDMQRKILLAGVK